MINNLVEKFVTKLLSDCYELIVTRSEYSSVSDFIQNAKVDTKNKQIMSSIQNAKVDTKNKQIMSSIQKRIFLVKIISEVFDPKDVKK